MSETHADADPVAVRPNLENLTVKSAIREGGGLQVEVLHVSFGAPLRTLEVRALDLGEQFDLAEMTGPNIGNQVWTNMAQMAASIRGLDGVPTPSVPHTRATIKAMLNRLGIDGLQAIMMALNGFRGHGQPNAAAPVQADHADAIKD